MAQRGEDSAAAGGQDTGDGRRVTASGSLGNDPRDLDVQYGTGERLATRASFWSPSPPGQAPQDIALAALLAAGPAKVLEIGCGRGNFARRLMDDLPGAEVLATDRSAGMVAAARELGVRAEQVDAGALPYDDDSFDAVVAMWMLYHVSDLDQTLAQVRRVLRPGGIFVAVTNGREHTADLRAAVGLGPLVTQFMAEDGARHLRRHFAQVEQVVTSSRAVADHASAARYIATFAPELAGRLPAYEGTRTYTGAGAVFVARA